MKYFVLFLFAVLAGCSNLTKEPPQMNAELIWSTHTERPDWVYVTPDNDDGQVYFVGQSYRYASEKGASQAAYMNALAELVQQAKPDVTKNTNQTVTSSGTTATTIKGDVQSVDQETILAQGFVQDVTKEGVYIEQWKSETGSDVFFKSFVLIKVDAKVYESLASAN